MGYKVAVVGATGEVGRTFLKVLEERNFPVDELYLFASSRSEGKVLNFNGKEYEVKDLSKQRSFKGIDLAFFSAGSGISKEFAPRFAKDGCVVIDNSSAFRLEEDIPLVVPEVNPEDLKEFNKKNIIANPNCSTIQMVVALKPLYDEVGITDIIVSTYQAVSGAGARAIEELREQVKAWCEGKEGLKPLKFPHPIAFNLIPHIDVFFEDGYTKEENKMLYETRKILHDQKIRVSATCVRVPVFYGHCESINVRTKREVSVEEARKILRRGKNVILMDEVNKNLYPTPKLVEGKDEVFVGRVRRCRVFEPGLSLWVVADNIRKGAATNGVQIALELIKEGLI